MEELGTTIKQIRQAKGLTQKEVYSGIVSRSFATRLENGEHDVTATKLFEILERLGVSADEFRFIQNDYRPDDGEILLNQVMLAYDQQNFPQLSHLAQRYGQSKNPAERRMATVAAVLLTAYSHRHATLTPDMERLWQQMMYTKSWTLQEIRLGPILMALIGFKDATIPETIRKMHQSCDRYVSNLTDPFHVMDLRLSFDLVALQVLLGHGDYDHAREFKNDLLSGHLEQLTSEGNLTLQLCLCIWTWFFGDAATADQQAKLLHQLKIERLDPGIRTLLSTWQQQAKRYHAKLGPA
ncbi:helix-turn-helix domain-containing protein [Levilactobacillus enshiensis]|uniref:helix-turn-helix domain-containing protein n=1 Tax=Levilactobacillus enshiensis TaxID=2590213 RepID=UPI00117ACED6|nr:helix-turn-helix transcriptional regulator [Levilactobacillus enshiensis]